MPIEAMYCGATGIACNSGGPLESIADGVTGFLLEPEAAVWTRQIDKIIAESIKTGQAGRQRAIDLFSFEAFADNLIESMTGREKLKKA